jgi:hypothetical protein
MNRLLYGTPGCDRGGEACFVRGKQLVQDASTRSQGVETLFSACGAGSDAACDLLQAHVKPPRFTDEMAPSGYPRAAIEHHESGLLLIECLIPESGVLRDCRAISGPPRTAPAFLRWFTGKKAIPLTHDGKPVPVDYVIPVRIDPVKPRMASDPSVASE